MKKILIFIIGTSLIVACSNEGSGDKKTELAKLKKEQAGIQEKINKLENELAAGDTTANGRSKEIAITPAVLKPFLHYIEVQAKVDGDENVVVSAEVPGIVTSVNVQSGQQVSKGTILVELDAASTTKAIEEAQNQLDFSNTLYMKQKSLWDQKVGSEVQYLTAKNNYEASTKRMATLKEQLAMTKLKSPINGTVDAVDIKIGQSLQPGIPAIRVVNLSSLKVKAEVAEAYVSKVKKGNEALIIFPDAGKEINSTLSYSGNVIDPLNRTFRVEVALGNKVTDLRPNMVAQLKIVDYKSLRAFSVPVNLIQKGEEGQYLFVAEGQGRKATARKRIVKTGSTYNGNVEILSGINEGDQIITTGYQDLVDGQSLNF